MRTNLEPAGTPCGVAFGRRVSHALAWVVFLFLATGISAVAQVSFKLLKSFGAQEFSSGRAPVGVIDGRDGWLYGVTASGGSNQLGTLYRENLEGEGHVILKHFDAIEGSPQYPEEIIAATDGFLYGVGGGGTNQFGTVFRMAKSGNAFSVIKRFAGTGEDGGRPISLVEGKDGDLYGVTYYWGGQGDVGRVFRMSKDGLRYQTLKRFTESPGEGTRPVSVLEGTDGLLYGTTSQGGLGGNGWGFAGTVFKLGKDGGGYQVLKPFTNSPTDGSLPGRLMEGGNGLIYGVTGRGGSTGEGTVFGLRKDGANYRVVRSLSSADGFGTSPSGLAEGLDGNLYGTCFEGGQFGVGCLFKVSKDGGVYEIFPFGEYWPWIGFPNSGMVRGTDGALYGTTCCNYRDSLDFGSVYRFNGGFAEFIFRFDDTGGDGRYPTERVTVSSNGVVFGITPSGGRFGGGVVFKMERDGAGYAILKNFGVDLRDSAGPQALFAGSDDALYGVTSGGGSNGVGTVFRLNKDGSGQVILRHFKSVDYDAKYPGNLMEGRDGFLYGVASGGSNNVGTVFRIDKTGGRYGILRHCKNSEGEGQEPRELVEGADGVLYGVSRGGINQAGVVFRLDKDGGGYAVVKQFGEMPWDGAIPTSLIDGSDGVLYGTTLIGGSNNAGTIFTVRKDGGNYRVLRHADSSKDAGWPYSVMEGNDGALYGTMGIGPGGGIVFRVDRAGGDFVPLKRFFDDSRPEAQLVQGLDGYFHGVTSSGGRKNLGAVFRMGAPLRVGWRRVGELESVDDRGNFPWTFGYRDIEILDLTRSDPGAEFATFLRNDSGFTPVLRRYDITTGLMLATNLGQGTSCLMLLTNDSQRFVGAQITSLEPTRVGGYELALYPVVRPGRVLTDALSFNDPWVTSRTAAVGAGRWAYDDYFLRGVASNERLEVRVETAEFSPFIEVRLLPDDSVQDYRDGSTYTLTVQGTEQGPRDYLIRVTSSASGALGNYTLRVDRVQSAPEIWSFSPGSGVPGTKVLVRGTNFLDGLNPMVTGVEFGGVPADWDDPVALVAAHEFAATVPPMAVSGPIRILTAGSVGNSTNAFIVLSPVSEIRREAGLGFSFAVSNAAAGMVNVIERTTSLTPPNVWTPVTTNMAGAGVWRYTNVNPGTVLQEFYRVRRQ